MRWIKKGMIYHPDGKLPWAKQHAIVPTPDLINEKTLRIYLTFCDEKGVGRVGFIDVDPNNPSTILNVSQEPALDIGQPGAFDDNGLLPTCIINHDNKKYLFYVGIQLGIQVRYLLYSGLAVSTDGGYTFTRISRVPILERTDEDLLFRGGPYVIQDGGVWKMWYVGGGEWTEKGGTQFPVYTLKYLESKDLTQWDKQGETSLTFQNSDEHGFGRPFITKNKEGYQMFYSIRRRSMGYRMGYAESTDGRHWTRKDDKVGIDVSEEGWDSGIICYASIVRFGSKVYMLYNGNYENRVTASGRNCLGYAELAE